MKPTVLLITSASDATSDLVVRHADAEVFRFNNDLFHSYKIRWASDGFRISDPLGRTISQQDVDAYYWRKPFMELPSVPGSVEEYDRATRREIIFSIADCCRRNGAWGLIDHRRATSLPKLLQLEVAGDLLPVPPWKFVSGTGNIPCESGWITKSLVTVPVGDGRYIMTSRIPADAVLDGAFGWFLQREIDASHDVTAVWCCGRSFAYSLSRDRLNGGVDWRIEQDVMKNRSAWRAVSLPDSIAKTLDALMDRLDLRFGRIDLLLDRAGTYWFLEINPNGQYAWLDFEGKHGMLHHVIGCACGTDGGTPRTANELAGR